MVWQLIRPDAVGALENPLIKKILPRYVKVVKDELPAKFQIAKRIGWEGISVKSEAKLWQVHRRLMKKFYSTLNEIDSGTLSLEELAIPEHSLLDLKILLVRKILEACELCERKCGVNRLAGERGVCRVGNECLISSEFIHMGEEPHITPSHTIFFMGCTLQCQYCQNYTISQWYERGEKIASDDLAIVMEMRRDEGARNVNFVGGEPTPHLLWILEALKACRRNIPTLWNSNFYMSEKTMAILDGVIDMHLSDFKYGNNQCALRLSKIPGYFDVCARNHQLAAKTTELTVRHLVLPNHVECCSKPVLKWIAENVRDKCITNIMDQYTPHWKALNYPEINRRLTKEEFNSAVAYARKLGINFIT